MAQINKEGLTPMQLGRLERALAKRFIMRGKVMTLEQIITDCVPADPAKTITDGMCDWSRTRFNRMNGAEQKAYEARLKARRYYNLECPDPAYAELECYTGVPKIVFDQVKGRITKDVDAVPA